MTFLVPTSFANWKTELAEFMYEYEFSCYTYLVPIDIGKWLDDFF